MTTVYIIRHSEPFKDHKGIEDTKDSIIISNIKSPLSIAGEKLAEKISKLEEFKNVDTVWSSNYVRAMSTAKYFANENNLKVNISDKLNERLHGVETWEELPSDFEQHQMIDENYKMSKGENKKEVQQRVLYLLNNLLTEYKDKRILIVGHSTATSFLLSTWCEINYESYYKFNGKTFFDGKYNYCETFKLTFDDKKLINIENVKIQ